MNKRIRNRIILIVAITVAAIYFFSGFPPSIQGMRERIRLGLDLKGGTQLILRVNVNDALRATTDQTIESLREEMEKGAITVRQFARTADDTFEVRGVDPAKDNDFRNLIEGSHPDFEIISSQQDGATTYAVRMTARAAAEYREQAVDQALNTIENRINALGVVEPVIQRRSGLGQSLVECYRLRLRSWNLPSRRLPARSPTTPSTKLPASRDVI
jgi:preprotein translocase subunit SecD